VTSNVKLATAIQSATLLAVAIIWYLAAASQWVSPLILPHPFAVIAKLVELLGRPDTYHHLAVTIYEFTAAILLALLIGITVGIIAGTIRYIGELIEPLLLALYAIPIIMAFPLCILFFGIGSLSKIAFAALYAFFPIAIQTMKGLRHVDRSLVRAAISMGAGRRQLLANVMFPAAMPVLMTGVRLGAVLGLLSVVAGEMLGALEGVGQKLSRSVEVFRSDEAFAWIMITIGLVTLVNMSIGAVEKRYES
jgi:ABC-type nitrate/sulfonate/bicarbonate transport system permease component